MCNLAPNHAYLRLASRPFQPVHIGQGSLGTMLENTLSDHTDAWFRRARQRGIFSCRLPRLSVNGLQSPSWDACMEGIPRLRQVF